MASCMSPTKSCHSPVNGIQACVIGGGVPDYSGVATGNLPQHVSSFNTVLKNNSRLPVLSTQSGKINNLRH